jgi:hypothetical protein
LNPLFQAGLEIQGFVEAKGWRFCFIGGLAVIRWGEPRITQDIDLSLFVGFGEEARYVRGLLKQFSARVREAERFALENRVLLLKTSNGVAADVSLAGLPFEERVIERASAFAFAPDCRLRTCSAEDLIVFKAFAARAKDWLDVEGIISRQAGRLDAAYIIEQLEPLAAAKEAPGIVGRVRRMLNQ